MPNTKSAKKMVRKIKKVTAINRSRMNRVRTFISKLKNIIKSGTKDEALKNFTVVESEVQRAATKGVISPNKSSRIVKRFCAKVKAMDAGAA